MTQNTPAKRSADLDPQDLLAATRAVIEANRVRPKLRRSPAFGATCEVLGDFVKETAKFAFYVDAEGKTRRVAKTSKPKWARSRTQHTHTGPCKSCPDMQAVKGGVCFHGQPRGSYCESCRSQ